MACVLFWKKHKAKMTKSSPRRLRRCGILKKRQPANLPPYVQSKGEPPMEKTIFLVEDDEYIRDGLVSVLTGEGYRVTACGSLAAARAALSRPDAAPDLLILDVLLPDGSGFSLCAEVRKTRRVPILFLTCCDEEMDTVRGLDCGGDDYVAKPFRLRELLSRIRVLLRRSDAASPERLQIGELILDSARRTVSRGGEVLALTPTEFHILYRLATGQGRILTRRQLLDAVWDFDGEFIEDNTLSVHMSRLRDKLGADGARIETVRGEGYRLL